MNKYINIIIIVSSALMLLPACRDCDDNYSVPQECKDYGYFLKGSYWVYRNDSTLEIDSFSATYDTTGWYSYPNENEGCNELTNGNAPFYNAYEYTTTIATSNYSGDSIEYSCGTGGVDFFLNNRFLGIYFIPDGRRHIDSSKWKLIDGLLINGYYYTDVYESTYSDSVKLFFEQNVGIIKYQRSSDTTDYVESRSIVRHHIIQ